MAFGELAMSFEERADDGKLTAVHHAKVTAVFLKTYFKLTGGEGWSFSPLGAMQEGR